MTNGGPGGSTTSLVYKVYRDGFFGADLVGSSAQSVVLFVLVLALTWLQLRSVENVFITKELRRKVIDSPII